MKRDDTIYLRHVLDALSRIEEYLLDVDEEKFLSYHLVQDGVIRQLEIIGEATKNLSGELRSAYPTIPWQDIAGMRDKLIHHYFGVDMEKVWLTTQSDLPVLKVQIQRIIQDLLY